MSKQKQIRVLIVDDHDMLRRGLALYIDTSPDLEVVGEAANGAEGVALCRQLGPDVVLMDLMMPEMDGVTAIRTLRGEFPELPIVALTSIIDEEMVQAALKAGASGYLLKTVGASELAKAIQAAHKGQVTLAPEVSRILVSAVQDADKESLPKTTLTAREQSIVALIADGASNGEIAAQLGIGIGTVKSHIGNILNKLGVRRRTELISLVLQGKIQL
jgi:two-component system, NarL family, response regulator LiaR